MIKKALRFLATGLVIYLGIVAYALIAGKVVPPGLGVLMILGPVIGLGVYGFCKLSGPNP